MLAFALKQEVDNENKAPKRNYNKPPLCKVR